MRIEFNGAIALVTGAASGLGRAAAVLLHQNGARVAGADRDMRGLEELSRETGGAIVELDVCRDDEIEAGIAHIEETLGPIDILVTAAGILQRPRAPDALPMAEWDRVLATNLRGTYRCCAVAGARMAKRGAGAIVTVSSVMGATPGPVHAYGPAKAAIMNLTQSLAAEWATRGVRVNGVAPGFVATPAIRRAAAFQFVNEDRLAEAHAQRRLVTAEEVAQAIAFLASDLASGITGVTLPVDGGYLAAAGWRGFDAAGPQER
ncbi:MAG: hypothetical protein BGP06_18605 [Rhizobiales bacterium 65-9]|nr:SDR family oxidoreductase [Hyphomicrobiales bacterium]OJY35004.1 MAG: hypothetical protein BGP06_18605 [Rhizobiales bacterium 65-9]